MKWRKNNNSKRRKRLIKPKVVSSKRSIKIDKKMQTMKYKLKWKKIPIDIRIIKT